MLKSRGIIHAQLRRALARIGYNSQIGIVDAGYNIPIGVEVIDLAFMPNLLTMLQVLEGVLGELTVEKMYVSYVSKGKEVEMPQLDEKYIQCFGEEMKISYLPEQEFRQMLQNSWAIIRTGEYGEHSPNFILQGGSGYYTEVD